MAEEKHESLEKTIAALKEGDRSAFASIYHRFGPKLLAFTRKMVANQQDAEEVVQEVFLKLWERKHFLDPEQHFDHYLFRMARNLVYNKARHQVNEMAYNTYLAREGSFNECAIDNYMDYQELNQLLEKTCASLPPVRKRVFAMSRLDGLSNGEIAEQLQTSASNIENHINKALHDIRKQLERFIFREGRKDCSATPPRKLFAK
jgi:RNA polymerase sigma-70 factor, ECF subfamily